MQAQRGGNPATEGGGYISKSATLIKGALLRFFIAKIKQLKFVVPLRSQIYNYIHLVHCGILQNTESSPLSAEAIPPSFVILNIG